LLKPTALVLAVAITFGVTPAEPAFPRERASLGDRVGLSTATVWLKPSEGYRYLRQARDGGVGWIREDFTWSDIEPRRGRFAWARTDALMRNAARLGLHVLAIATYAPGWASGHPESNKFPPTNPQDYATFVKAIADRYGRGGTFWRTHRRLVPSPLTAIELWNEPWHISFWGTGPDPTAYARSVRAAATAVKAGRPRMALLASADVSASGGAEWFRPLLAADPDLWRSGLVDAWSVHLYSQERSPWDAVSPQRYRFDRLLVTRAVARSAGADKPVWITEFGWSTEPGAPDAVSEQTQAQYEHDALVRATTEWSSFVRRSFVFTLTKPSVEADAYNLLRLDGSARPAWQAIRSLASSGT
jgi:polysaccharide biosynthesis protein PslG